MGWVDGRDRREIERERRMYRRIPSDHSPRTRSELVVFGIISRKGQIKLDTMKDRGNAGFDCSENNRIHIY